MCGYEKTCQTRRTESNQKEGEKNKGGKKLSRRLLSLSPVLAHIMTTTTNDKERTKKTSGSSNSNSISSFLSSSLILLRMSTKPEKVSTRNQTTKHTCSLLRTTTTTENKRRVFLILFHHSFIQYATLFTMHYTQKQKKDSDTTHEAQQPRSCAPPQASHAPPHPQTS